MKTLSKLFFLASFFFVLNANAQATEKMSYQVIICDVSNALLTNQNVGMRISLWQGSTIGTLVYEETQKTTTNQNGLATLKIGEGTVVSGSISGIYWQEGPYFIKTEIDPAGATNYTITAESQLLSVPMALHSNTTSSVVGHKGFIPKFVSDSKIENSSIYYSLDKIGVNTTNPQATFEIKGGNTGSLFDAQPTLTVANETYDYYGFNIFQLKSSVNSDYNAIKFSKNDGTINSAIIAKSTVDVFNNSYNTLSFFVKDITNPEQINLSEKLGIQLGKSSTYFNKINFYNVLLGNSTTQKKIINIIYPNSDPTNIIANVTIKQVGSFSDIFSISTSNFTTSGFDVVIYRIDGTSWGQKLEASISIINK